MFAASLASRARKPLTDQRVLPIPVTFNPARGRPRPRPPAGAASAANLISSAVEMHRLTAFRFSGSSGSLADIAEAFERSGWWAEALKHPRCEARGDASRLCAACDRLRAGAGLSVPRNWPGGLTSTVTHLRGQARHAGWLAKATSPGGWGLVSGGPLPGLVAGRR